MIKGTYIFKQDGVEIFRSENVITKFGKRFLTNFIAGNVAFSKKDLALGIDNTSATVNDTRLGFEFYRLPVELGTIDIQTIEGVSTYSVVYKSTIPADVSATISEVGLYPSNRSSTVNYDSKFLLDFNDRLSIYDPSGNHPISIDTENGKIGGNLITLTSNSTSPKEYVSLFSELDISGYSVNDSIRLAYYKNDTNLEKIVLRFYSSDLDYYYYEITPDSGTGYKITDDILINELLSYGSPNNSSIIKIGITIYQVSGQSTSVGMDGLRIND